MRRRMAANTTNILAIADSLPIDLKIKLVDRLLESISPAQADMDELWKAEVEQRVDDIESGRIKSIPGEEVQKKIREQFS